MSKTSIRPELQKALNEKLLSYIRNEKSLEEIEELVSEGADVNYKTINENTAIIYAINKENYKVLKYLIELGIDVNTIDGDGGIVLMDAVYKGNYDIVKLLIDSGADVNLVDNEGYSSLMFTGKVNIIKLLLENGASPFVDVNKLRCKKKECRELIEEYAWKKLKETDLNTARKLGKYLLNKDVWQLILLNERQRRLCKNLDKPTNIYLLTLFAIDVGADPESLKTLTKAELCGLISRQIARGQGEGVKEVAKNKIFLDKINNQIYGLAKMYNVSTDQDPGIILKQIAERIGK